MATKLTLKLDETVILSAKKYAANNHRSLSRLVENYFRSLTVTPSHQKKHSPLVESLIGVVDKNAVTKLVAEDPKSRWIVERAE
jgi:hypothetical protein